MSWNSMATELAADMPVPFPKVLTIVQRAWLDIQDSYMWSFLWGDAAIPTATPITAGTCTPTIGLKEVIGSVEASAAWLATGLACPFTTRQFRVGQGTIYNIDELIDNGDLTATLVLSQIYVDPTDGVGTGYQVTSTYFNGPTRNFLWWESIKDPISGYDISTTMTREEIDFWDPQRFQSGWPKGVTPYAINQQEGNFNGFPMYEMWPAPLNNYTYVGTYFSGAIPFLGLNDQVPPPLGEDVVLAQAKYWCAEWCLQNPDKVPRHEGSQRTGASGWQFLMAKAEQEKKALLNKYILKDEQFSHRSLIAALPKDFFNALPWVSMKANVMANV